MDTNDFDLCHAVEGMIHRNSVAEQTKLFVSLLGYVLLIEWYVMNARFGYVCHRLLIASSYLAQETPITAARIRSTPVAMQ
jgi:hypothetical protein